MKPWCNRDFLLKNPSRQPIGRNRSDQFGKPVRPVFAWTVRKNTARGKNSTHPPIDLPIRSTDQSETLGIDGVPRGLPLARSPIPKIYSIKRNRKSTPKSTSNPRTPKPPKSSPLTHGLKRGITVQRTTKGSHKFHRRSKTDVTLLSGVRCGKIKTRGKGNFVHCAMD
jgi:hypothetical protein